MGEKYSFDDYERKIIREIIKNPKISDNKISRITEIPLKTVNRKRKILEKKNMISYYLHVNHGKDGTATFGSERLYIIKFKLGISRKLFLDVFNNRLSYLKYNNKHITYSRVGEVDGHLGLVIILASRTDSDLIEILNVDVIGQLNEVLGNDCVENIEVVKLNQLLRIHNNYMFGESGNLSNGIIRDDVNNDSIFVD